MLAERAEKAGGTVGSTHHSIYIIKVYHSLMEKSKNFIKFCKFFIKQDSTTSALDSYVTIIHM